MVVPNHPGKPIEYAVGFLGERVELPGLDGSVQLEFLGAQPVEVMVFLAPLLRRWGLRARVDQAHPTGSEISHGQVMEILVANRLTDPEPLYRIVEWAQDYDTQRWFGVAPEKLTDDRIGETLDAVGPSMEGLQAQWSAEVLAACRVSLEQIYYDLSSLMFYTKEDTPEKDKEGKPNAVRVLRGHTRDHRPELRQVVVGMSAAADGLVPLLHASHDGNQGDTATVVDHVAEVRKQFKKLLGMGELFVVGDSKLLSVDNIQALLKEPAAAKGNPSQEDRDGVRVEFVAPSTRSGHWAKRLQKAVAARGRGEWERVDYQSVRTQLELAVEHPRREQPFKAPEYEMWESEAELKNKKKKSVTVREVFVYDSGKAEQERGLRERALLAVGEKIEALRGKLGKYTYTTAEAIRNKVKQILNKHIAAKPFVNIVVRRRQGQWELVVRQNEKALEQAKQADGIYSLLTSKSKAAMSGGEVLRAFKEETRIERRWAEFKGPIRVRPIFVRTPVRIVALVGITMMAMLLWAMVERQCRQGEEKERGRTLKPITARQVWRRFKHLCGQVAQLVDEAGNVLRPYFVINKFNAQQNQVLCWLSITEEDIQAVLAGSG